MTKLSIASILFLFSYLSAYSQPFDGSLIIPNKDLINNPYTCYHIADSFSKKGDSINASYWFMKMNPYLLLRFNVTPKNIDTFFADFSLTVSAKSEYRTRFETLYNIPRTETYKTFKEMHDEDQSIRTKLDNCKDSISCAEYDKRMDKTDSVHFVFLKNYVKKYGWPTLENGSLYAYVLVYHNTENHEFYLPFMKKAALDGLESVASYYYLLNHIEARKNPSLTEYALKTPNKVAIDVSSMLKGTMPDINTINQIKTAISSHCPIKYFVFIEEWRTDKEQDAWWKKLSELGETHRVYFKIIDDVIHNAQCEIYRQSVHLDHVVTHKVKKRLLLYIVY